MSTTIRDLVLDRAMSDLRAALAHPVAVDAPDPRIKKRMAYLNAVLKASFELTYELCALHSDGKEMLKRSDVMDLVVKWRAEIDAVAAIDAQNKGIT